MKNLFTMLFLLSFTGMMAQVDFNAHDFITPYEGVFRPGINLGYYQGWNTRQLGDLAGGNPELGVLGVGAKTLRPVLSESVLEIFGYDVVVDEFEHFQDLGMGEFTAVLAFPVDWHRDYTEYCPGHPSTMFANLYTDIWDGGANGTPYNDENYFAAYVYKTVTTYTEYVKFWEIWNEPGFDLTGNLGWRDAGDPQGNWWDNDPNPCDNILRAPIEHYVRTIRIAHEVIKTISPDDYVAVAGFGFQSFLDAVLRNTDNPNGGGVTEDYPHSAGAYFDIMGLHNYPHFDGTTRRSNEGFFERHSDQAAQGLLYRRDFFQEIFDNYGYNGNTYPRKLTICTEMNVPREFPDNTKYFASTLGQRNYIMKTFITAILNNIINWHVYSIGDNPGKTLGFSQMGLYEDLEETTPFNQTMHEIAIAMKTTSDQLWGTIYDAGRTDDLNAPDGVKAYAFLRPDGRYTYMMWAETVIDQSEFAEKTYNFPGSFDYDQLDKIEWNYSVTNDLQTENATGIDLNATPIFLIEQGGNTGTFVSINCPNDIEVTIPFNDNSTIVDWNQPNVTTNCVEGQNTITQTAGPDNGVFSVGTTTVTYQVTNGCGQSAFCSFTVKVTKEEEPTNGNYCPAGGAEPWSEYIKTVQLQEINNISGKCDTECGYGNFTHLTATLNAGTTYDITLTPGISWAGQDADLYWRVWIDYNGDGDFTDAGELEVEAYGGREVITESLSVSSNAGEIVTRMRIATKKGGYADPCEFFLKGEVEDYTVSIQTDGTGCNEIGQACDDGNACTEGDVINAACDCVGTFADDDNDGVCNADDACPGSDDNVDDNNNGIPDGCDGPTNGEYCEAESERPWEQYIRNVKVGSIDNMSGKCDNGCGYSDFTNLSTNLAAGSTNTIELTAKYSFENYDEYWRAWIDYNGDGNFSMDEMIISRFTADLGYGIITHTVVSDFTIPNHVVSGATRMRVILSREGYPSACGIFGDGEVEDYTIVLQGGTGVNSIGSAPATPREESTLTQQQVELFPNPASTELNLDLSGYTRSAGMVRIQNQVGQIMMEMPLESVSGARTTINLDKMESGIYFLSIQPLTGTLITKRFSVVKH